MATFKSEKIVINAPAESVFNKLSNLESLGDLLRNVPEDKIPADQREKLKDIEITSDTISFPGGPVGSVSLRLTEAVAPRLIRLEGAGTPVPLSMTLNLEELGADCCEAQVDIDIQIPAMLKPMVSGPLQKMVDQFAEMLHSIPFS